MQTLANPVARIAAVNYFLPDATLTNEQLSDEFPEWSVDKIGKKTGISSRRVAINGETTSSLAAKAAERLLSVSGVDRASIDYLILCTQSPDYYLPSTACIVQDLLGLPTNAGAMDINLGCSGYVYGLGLASALVESGQAANVLFITADTYSKFLNPSDKSVRTIFGDGASATLVSSVGGNKAIYGFSYGTDGAGAKHLIVPNGGLADGYEISPRANVDDRGLTSNGFDLYMDGAEVFNFTLRVVPECIQQTFEKTGLSDSDIDAYIFHQANSFMLNTLRKKIGISPEKFIVEMENCGNTVSSSIPIALTESLVSGKIKSGMKVMLVGFGVGLSWGAVIVEI
ncbi:ketoacyl-ACP synthase III [Paeniglutamicibacter sp. ZC-3]|uniref:3-oxoacyl-ACP synthase III family protein n=1 Tax=Paeniglutamicibacter sp. ZC-3 TaxID=2986919 RepID=UPI0021F7DE28|nr:ketoacyl-ACP synthase III [Paeniglutamicibacter sp. ZC-3]MCV9996607.1 ketoacyl-ACP synthase III [Paeniglutamicibacter sp. ZC-3]